jgi:hypothetical protein
MSRRTLSRRAVLRGLAAGSMVTVGLPLLEIMVNESGTALADGSALPSPFMTWFFGNGVRLGHFEPTQVGANWQLSEELAPLVNVKEYITVCTGLQNRCAMQITHHEGMTVFNGYTFTDWNGGLYSKAGGPTIDQVIADKIAGNTPVKSVQVGVSKRTSIMDSGTTMFAMSHRSANEPLYPEFNPQKVWQTLFGAYVPKPDDRALRISVLDSVNEDLKKLRGKLGAGDQARVDAHMTGIQELEAKINAVMPTCSLPEKPTEANVDIAGNEPIVNVNKVQSDLLLYAFTCDITRVASLFFIGGAAETTYSDLGQTTGHHYNTHDPSRQDQVNQGVIYQMQRLAYLLEQRKAKVDPMGQNMLDTSLVYISTDCSEGLTHSIARQPIILAGHRRNKLVYPGIHYQAAPYPQSAGNTSDVLLTVLQAYDPTATSVGGDSAGSTTPIAALKGTA